jgi:hypothetical protein
MLFVECKPDYSLATILSSKKVQHAGNKSGVIKKLVRSSGVPNFENSTGMVDEDPLSSQNPDLNQFTELKSSNKAKIKVLYYRWLNNGLIVLCPRLEEWIIAAAREAQIRLKDYDLPDSPAALHEVINLRTDRFEDLVESLRDRSARVIELQRLLRQSGRRRSTRNGRS